MRSWKWPKMFNSNSSAIWKSTEHREATSQNIKLLLGSCKKSLACDPYFGGLIDQFMFDQNSYILKEALLDVIYEQLCLFVPQIYVQRDGITITQGPEKGKLYCTIHALNNIDYTNDTYSLLIYENSTSE